MKTLTATKRNQTDIKGIVYKKGMENIMVSVPENMVRSLWKDINNKQEFILDIEGDTHTVIIQDMQTHVVTGAIMHMDFLVQ